MALSYKKLWKILIDRDMTRGDLHLATGVAPSTLTKMSKGEYVATSVIERICRALDCDVGDIMEVVPDEAPPRSSARQCAASHGRGQ